MPAIPHVTTTVAPSALLRQPPAAQVKLRDTDKFVGTAQKTPSKPSPKKKATALAPTPQRIAKRKANTEAASRCRARAKAENGALETEAKTLQSRNQELKRLTQALQTEKLDLLNQCLDMQIDPLFFVHLLPASQMGVWATLNFFDA